MTELTKPSKELAKKLLYTELGYDEQLMGVRLTPMAGNVEHPIYSFPEAVRFLHMDPLEKLLSGGSGGKVNYIDLKVLQRWLAEVFGDTELAQAIGEVVKKADYFGQMVGPVKELLEQRLAQCYAVLEENGPENEPEKA